MEVISIGNTYSCMDPVVIVFGDVGHIFVVETKAE